MTSKSKPPGGPDQQPTLAGPTSFLAQLATHACLSASSWSFRAFSSIWRGTDCEWPSALGSGKRDPLLPLEARPSRHSEGGWDTNLVPLLLLLLAPLKVSSQGSSQGCGASLQLLPQFLQLYPLPAGQKGHCERV